MRIVTTPLPSRVRAPDPHGGGFDPALQPVLIDGPGQEALRAGLAAPGVLAVTTGQQPALFTGPLYTVHKALSAAALARTLTARWGRPVQALFWVAADDHDFAEANHAAWLRPDGALHVETLPPREAEAALRPMAREPLPAAVARSLAALGADLAPYGDPAPALDWLGRHFRPGTTLGAASAGALAELLAPLGVLCVDGAHAALKRKGAPLVRAALERAGELEDLLVRRAAGLRAEGHDPGVLVGDGATLVMLDTEQGRDRLVRDGTGFRTRHGRRHYERAELLDLLEQEPGRFSGNVLLRPVLERAVLPTVAYVGGPGELRYLALAEVLYPALGVTAQLPVPRWSGQLVEPRVDRVLAKYGATVEELLAPDQALEARVVRAHLPPEAPRALAALREALAREYGVLAQVAATVDPTLARPLGGLRGRAEAGLERADRKLLQHLKRRHAEDTAQIARARTALLPGGRPQERVLTVAPYLARYGHGVLPALLTEMEAWYHAALEGGGGPP